MRTGSMGTSVAATVAVAVIIVLALAHATYAEIRTTLIVSDARPLILFEQFGFARGGKAALSIRRSTWRLRPGSRLAGVDPTLMGFVLISGSQFPKMNNASEYAAADPGGNSGGGGFCVLTSGFAVPMIRLSDVPAGGATSILPVDDPDEYAVVFNNCQEGVEVTMDVRTEMYNVRGDGRRDYLPVGLQPLPTIYTVVSAVYFAFLAVWAWACLRRRATAERIHAVIWARCCSSRRSRWRARRRTRGTWNARARRTAGTSPSTSSASSRASCSSPSSCSSAPAGPFSNLTCRQVLDQNSVPNNRSQLHVHVRNQNRTDFL